MPWIIAAAAVGGGLISGIMGQSSASKQADTTKYAANISTQAQLAQYVQNREDLLRASGQAGTIYDTAANQAQDRLNVNYGEAASRLDQGRQNALMDLDFTRSLGRDAQWRQASLLGIGGKEAADAAMQGFTTSPGYEFQLSEGLKAADRSAAARGGLLGGRAIKAAESFGSGLAAQEYGNYWNRLAGVAGAGAQSDAQAASIDANAGAAQSSLAYGAGRDMSNSIFQGATGKANALLGSATQAGAWGQQTAQSIANIDNTAAARTASIYGAAGANLQNTFNSTANNLLYAYGRGWLGGSPSNGTGYLDAGVWD